MYNQTDELIVELLRVSPRRKVELEEQIPASNVYHRCLKLMAAGRIKAIRTPEHKETVYALSEAEKEKESDVDASLKDDTDACLNTEVNPNVNR